MKLEPNTIYHCKTRDDAEEFFRDCDEQNICWSGGEKASSFFHWDEDHCCYVIANHNDNQLSLKYGSMESCQECFEDYPTVVYQILSPEELAARDLAWKQMMGIS